MAIVKLLNYQATEISYKNELTGIESFELSNKCTYHLGFAQNKLCRGEMIIEIFNKKEPEKFFVKVKVIGNFLREDASPEDDVHKSTYKLLFPHARAIVTAVSVDANIPPLFFPDINIDGQSVYMVPGDAKPKK